MVIMRLSHQLRLGQAKQVLLPGTLPIHDSCVSVQHGGSVNMSFESGLDLLIRTIHGTHDAFCF